MEVRRIANKIIKQGSTKTQIKICFLRQNWVLVVPPIKTFVIYCQNIWFHQDFNHIILKKDGILLSYINKVKYINDIVIPTTCGY